MGLFPSRGLIRWGMLLAFVVSIGMSGCGPSTATVTGKVYLDETPLKGGTVVFLPADGKGYGRADIQEDGSYKIEKAPAGKGKITVDTEWMNPANRADTSKFTKYGPPPGAKAPDGKTLDDIFRKDKAGDLGARYIPIPPDYADPDKTTLTYDVKSGKQEHNIKLTSSTGGAGR
jgi:hypothetical protein